MRYFDLFLNALNTTAPLVVLTLLGALLRQRRIITAEFIRIASWLVFNLALPALMFSVVKAADWHNAGDFSALLFIVIATIALFLLAFAIAPRLMPQRADRQVFVQGAYRGNLGIISTALCFAVYGQEGLVAAALPITVLTILYNVLAALILPPVRTGPWWHSLALFIKDLLSNPILIGIGFGFLISSTSLSLPMAIENSVRYLSQMSLPLALLAVGASLNLKTVHKAHPYAWMTVGFRLVLAPALVIPTAWAFGYTGMTLGIFFCLTAAPIANASFVMVYAAKGNAELAAEAVALSTLCALLTLTLGLFALQALKLI